MNTCFTYGIELNITKNQARQGSHAGQCDMDVKELLTVPAIKRQLGKLSPETTARELAEYGAWDSEELRDAEANKARLLWIACGDIVERLNS